MTFALINVILSLILGIVPIFESSSNEDEDSTVLKYVDLSKDPILMSILHEAMGENGRMKYSPSEKVNYYSLYLKDEKDVIRCYVTAHTKKRLSNYDGWTGYTMVGSMPVIITNESKYRLTLHPETTRQFPMDPPSTPPYIYDPAEWFFLIKDDTYAMLIFGVGWIWDKPLDINIVRKEDRYRLIAPMRTFRPRRNDYSTYKLTDFFPNVSSDSIR